MEDIHVGDKVVVKIKDSFTSEANNGKSRVLGNVVFVSAKGTFSVVNVGKYNVTYWNNEIMPFDPEKFEVDANNRVNYINPASSDSEMSAEQ